MNGRLVTGAVVCAFAGAACADGVIADRGTLDYILSMGESTTDDFETYDFGGGTTFNGAGSTLDETSFVNGQGPNLVGAGANYGGLLQWNSDGYFGLEGQSLNSYASTDLTIEYETAATAMGFDMEAFDGFSQSVTIEVFDASGSLIEALVVTDGYTNSFFGYEYQAGIGSISISGNGYPFTTTIDNHTYGPSGAVVPLPSVSAMAGLGLIGLGTRRRRPTSL